MERSVEEAWEGGVGGLGRGRRGDGREERRWEGGEERGGLNDKEKVEGREGRRKRVKGEGGEGERKTKKEEEEKRWRREGVREKEAKVNDQEAHQKEVNQTHISRCLDNGIRSIHQSNNL